MCMCVHSISFLMETLSAIRVGGGAVILGIVVGALQDVLPWIEERTLYGGVPLAQKSHIQLQLGDLYSKLLTTRLMVHRAAKLKEEGLPYTVEASVAKLRASTLAVEATSTISSMFGWRGIDNAFAIQKRARDAQQTTIFEGTTQLQQLNLFRTLRHDFATRQVKP